MKQHLQQQVKQPLPSLLTLLLLCLQTEAELLGALLLLLLLLPWYLLALLLLVLMQGLQLLLLF
jgi:hypothetical protein